LVNKVTEKEIPYVVVSRRPGDIDISIANAQKARQVLGWEYNRSMYQAIEDARRFIQSQNN
jgi:UDP-glucose 4-epimerase